MEYTWCLMYISKFFVSNVFVRDTVYNIEYIVWFIGETGLKHGWIIEWVRLEFSSAFGTEKNSYPGDINHIRKRWKNERKGSFFPMATVHNKLCRVYIFSMFLLIVTAVYSHLSTDQKWLK